MFKPQLKTQETQDESLKTKDKSLKTQEDVHFCNRITP